MKKQIKDIQIQWVFVLFGALLAFVGGIVINALYELLREHSSPLFIVLIFGALFLLILDSITFLFQSLEKVDDKEYDSNKKVFHRYIEYCVKRIYSLF